MKTPKKLKDINTQSIDKFVRAAETAGEIYFIDENETDETTNTLIYRKEDLTLLSNNCFASDSFFADAEDNNFTWMSESCKINVSEILAAIK